MLSKLYWLELPSEVRAKLRQQFLIPRSTFSSVVNLDKVARVESDGHTDQDLATLTLERLQQFVGTDIDDYYKVLTLAIGMLMGDIQKLPKEAEIEIPKEVVKTLKSKKHVQKKK